MLLQIQAPNERVLDEWYLLLLVETRVGRHVGGLVTGDVVLGACEDCQNILVVFAVLQALAERLNEPAAGAAPEGVIPVVGRLKY